MSLSKIAQYKRKRKFYDGGGGGDAEGPNGPDGGYNGGDNNFGADYGGNEVGESVSGTAAEHAGTNVGVNAGEVGESVSGTAAEHAGSAYSGDGGISNTAGYAQRQGVGGLSADGFGRSALGSFSDKAMPMGGIGALAVGVAKAMDALTGAGYSHPDFGPGGKYEGMGGSTIAGGDRRNNGDGPDHREGGSGDAQPFGTGTPVQTTNNPAAPAESGPRRYVWDPVLKMYTLANLGAGSNPMAYSQGQQFRMGPSNMYAAGGIAAGQPRFVQGGGTGLSDSVPVQMDDGGQGRLGDGEFVIPADVVSGLGGGSSQAGAKILYDMMEKIRMQAHGSPEQVKPVNPNTLPA